jgi:hypothetical protein
MITDSVIVKKYQNAIFSEEEIDFLRELRDIAESIGDFNGKDSDDVFHTIVEDIESYAHPNVNFDLEIYYE